MTSWKIEQGFLAAFSLLAFIIAYIPLAWHFEAWNVGCVLYIFWVGTQCLIQFINHMVWWDNAINLAPVWCDITIRFTFIAHLGVVSAGLVIARRLCIITTGTTVHSGSRRDKYRSVAIDLAIGLGIPLAQLIIFFFVQGHRFDIYEGVGCYGATPGTWLLIVLSGCWPIPIGLVSAYYSVRTLLAFSKRRKEFSELLASNSNLTFNRYFRLMAMACIEILCTVPINIYTVVLSATHIGYKYAGLTDLHLGFGRVRQYPAEVWLSFPGQREVFEINEWLFITCALVFFIIFGMAEEAKRHYRSAYTTVAKRLGISTGSMETSASGFTATGSKMGTSGFGRITIPTFIQRNASKRDSLGSFSDRLSTSISVGEFGGFDDEKISPYSPSDSTAGSSTCFGSPVDEKTKEMEVPEVAKPESVHDVESIQRHSGSMSPVGQHHNDVDVEAQRQAPSVELPSSVRNSIDIV